MTYPNGRVLNYSYGAVGSLDDAISRLVALVDSDGETPLELYTYLGDGTVVVRSNPASTLTLESAGTSDSGDHYTGLDRFGRVIDQKWVSTADPSQVTDDFAYTYDADSNVKTRADNVSGAPASEAYDYDNLNRLSSATGGLYGSQDWTLDAVGNMNSVTAGGITDNRQFNTLNQLAGGNVQGQPSPITYDADGNTTTDQHGYTMVYDAWNRLVEVLNGSDQLETYSYNGQGYRVLQSITPDGASAAGGSVAGVSAGTTAYYYSNQWQVLEEHFTANTTGATPTLQAQFVWSPVYVNALVCQDSAIASQNGNWGKSGSGLTQRLFIQQDVNFNVTAVVCYISGTWQVQQREVYDPYGKQLVRSADWTVTSDAVLSLRSFQGGLMDQITGNINFDYRDYNPATMTWNTQDPLVFVDGVNWYEPEAANPINDTDLTGLAGKTVELTTKFKAYVEWFPDQGVGEAKVMNSRTGEELARFRFNSVEGTVAEILDHKGNQLPGASRSVMRKIAPALRDALQLMVKRTGGVWEHSIPAVAREAGQDLGKAVAISGGKALGMLSIGGIIGLLLDLNMFETKVYAPSVPIASIDKFEFDVSEMAQIPDNPVGYKQHVIQAGDTLWGLWTKRSEKSIPWRAFIETAKQSNADIQHLKIGDTVCVPR
jgi:RHS repeat-associated protein